MLKLQDVLNWIYKNMHPVGSILMTTDPRNPGTYLGGTWVAWGAGRVPVGVDTGDTDFATVEKPGGAKVIEYTPSGSNAGTSLGTNQLPAHSHALSAKVPGMSGSWHRDTGGTISGSGGIYVYNDNGATIANISATNNTGSGAAHSHTFTGTHVSLNKVQPYITCYMFKRTA